MRSNLIFFGFVGLVLKRKAVVDKTKQLTIKSPLIYVLLNLLLFTAIH